MKRWRTTTNAITLGWCGAVMIVLGSWMPPRIEAPEPPRIELHESK